jgi:predicted O-methyltransferase YrrM
MRQYVGRGAVHAVSDSLGSEFWPIERALDSAFDYARHLGQYYGSEKISFLLYSLVRMRRPDHVIELGCGTGATAFCMAQALCENDNGRLLTVDNEAAWPELAGRLPLASLGVGAAAGLGDYVRAVARRLRVDSRLTYHKSELPPFPAPKGSLDLLYVDYNHRPENVIRILATYLPVMAPSSAILFDSAATYFPTYQLLENFDRAVGAGRTPASLLRDQEPERALALSALIERSRIRTVHFFEKDKAEQNSASMITIDPYDIVPPADVTMRMW